MTKPNPRHRRRRPAAGGQHPLAGLALLVSASALACVSTPASVLASVSTPAPAPEITPVSVAGAALDSLWTVPLLEKGPTLDGRLDEPCWGRAPGSGAFRQAEPTPGRAPSEPTYLRLLADREHLYIGFECGDSQPEAIRAHELRRDQAFRDDWVAVLLAGTGSGAGAIELFVNPRGCLMDAYQTGQRDDLSMDYDFTAAADRGAHGWSAELAIPWRLLGGAARAGRLRLLALRQIARMGERVAFPECDLQAPGWHQRGIRLRTAEVAIGARAELLPSLVATRTRVRGAPGRDGWAHEAGLTGRWHTARGLRAALAVRPDFRQVEADVPQLETNRRYPVYYPEKRPFFLSERELFTLAGTGETIVRAIHTRTIVAPLWAACVSRDLGAGGRAGVLCAYERAPDRARWGVGEEAAGAGRFTGLVRLRGRWGERGQAGVLLSTVGDEGRYISVGAVDAVLGAGSARVSGHLIASDTGRGGGPPLAATLRGWVAHRAWTAEATASLVDPAFRLPAGLVADTDCRRWRWRLERRFHPATGPLTRVAASAEGRYRWSHAGEAFERWMRWRLSGRLGRRHEVWIGLARDHEHFGGRGHSLARVWAGAALRPAAALALSGEVTSGRALLYDPADPQRGRVRRISGAVTLDPGHAVACEGIVLHERLRVPAPGGEERGYAASAFSLRPRWRPSRRWGMRLILDWWRGGEGVLADLLVTVHPSRQGELQLGYGGRHAGGGSPSGWRAREQTFFLKYARRFVF